MISNRWGCTTTIGVSSNTTSSGVATEASSSWIRKTPMIFYKVVAVRLVDQAHASMREQNILPTFALQTGCSTQEHTIYHD